MVLASEKKCSVKRAKRRERYIEEEIFGRVVAIGQFMIFWKFYCKQFIRQGMVIKEPHLNSTYLL